MKSWYICAEHLASDSTFSLLPSEQWKSQGKGWQDILGFLEDRIQWCSGKKTTECVFRKTKQETCFWDWDGERLRALTALTEDLNPVHSTHVEQLNATCNSSSRESDTLSLDSSDTCTVCMCTFP